MCVLYVKGRSWYEGFQYLISWSFILTYWLLFTKHKYSDDFVGKHIRLFSLLQTQKPYLSRWGPQIKYWWCLRWIFILNFWKGASTMGVMVFWPVCIRTDQEPGKERWDGGIAPARVASAGEESPRGTKATQSNLLGFSYEGHSAGNGSCADIIHAALCSYFVNVHGCAHSRCVAATWSTKSCITGGVWSQHIDGHLSSARYAQCQLGCQEQCSKMLIENYSGKRAQWTIAMEAAAARIPLRRSICSPTAK